MSKLDFIRGIIRPLLTLIGFVVSSYLVIVHMLSVEVYIPLVTMMVVFWFGDRNNKNNHNNGQQ